MYPANRLSSTLLYVSTETQVSETAQRFTETREVGALAATGGVMGCLDWALVPPARRADKSAF